MNKKTNVLQIGEQNWENYFTNDQHNALSWTFLDVHMTQEEDCKTLIKEKKKRAFDVVLCTDFFKESLLKNLSPLIESYALILDSVFKKDVTDEIIQTKCPIFMSFDYRDNILDTIQRYFFSGQMGSKLHVHTIEVSEAFKGEIVCLGEHRLSLKGSYPGLNQPVVTWQYNMGMFGRSKKLWLEFEAEEGLDVAFVVQGIREGTSQVMGTWRFDQEALRTGIEIPYQEGLGYLSLALSVYGMGSIRIGPLHYRDSRGSYGEYILGGQKIVDDHNEELYYYFHPGDLKPPLTVYFSGYRSAEGFEGFYMMKKLGAPFLLITDPGWK